uniref:Uncharacterized protein n=1 Tax=viral metagenome TaxID=1070528 RepID=A0A6C0BM86_9ZZZZ
MTGTVECRRYPWLFKQNSTPRTLRLGDNASSEEITSQDSMVTGLSTMLESFRGQGVNVINVMSMVSSLSKLADNMTHTISLRPFNDERITAEDVITLMISHGYVLNERDVSDIARCMRISEISKLVRDDRFIYKIDINELRHNPDLCNETSKLIHQERLKLPGEAKITSYWSLHKISKHIHVSEILKYAYLKWNADRIEHNPTVTLKDLKELRRIDELWRYESVIRRMTCEDVMDMMIQGEINELLWKQLSRSMHIDEIMRADDELAMLGLDPRWTSHVWFNSSIREEHIPFLTSISNPPRAHILSRLDDIDLSELMGWEIDVISSGPEGIKMLDLPVSSLPVHRSVLYRVYRYVNIDQVDMTKASHQEYFRKILTRHDITEQQVRRIISTCPSDVLPKLSKPRSLPLSVTFELFKDVTYQELQSMTHIELDQLHTYPCKFDLDQSIANMNELIDHQLDIPSICMNPKIPIDFIMSRVNLNDIPDIYLNRIFTCIHPGELLKISDRLPRYILNRRRDDASITEAMIDACPDTISAIRLLYPWLFYKIYNDNGSINVSDINILFKTMRYNGIVADYNRLRALGREDIVVRSFKPMSIVDRFHDLDIIAL